MPRPIDMVLEKLEGTRRSGDSGRQWTACCPAHEDAKQSLAIGLGKEDRVLLCCYAGCEPVAILRAVGLSWGDLFEEDSDKGPKPTVSSLAFERRLPTKFLKDEFGLSDLDGAGVGIPYYDIQRERIALKRRVAAKAKDGSYWPKATPLSAYGLWLLPRARAAGKTLYLVEGESDTWTLWYHSLPALGLPGANAVKTLTAEALEGIEELFCWQEPDGGGAKFIEGIGKQLKAIGWQGKALVLAGGAIKDPNDLHRRDPDGFKEAFAQIVASAKAPETNTSRAPKAVSVPGAVIEQAEETAKIPTPAPGFYGLTDWGNAQRLVFRHGRDLRYCHAWGCWLIWDGRRWKVDNSGEIVRRATDTVRAIYAEAAAGSSAEIRQAISQHAEKSESVRYLDAMVKIARSEPGIPINPDALDMDPWLFNCLNGTVDLRTGQLRNHRREDYLTKMAPCQFDATATCPAWEAFLQRIMGGAADLVSFLKLAIGYSLTADVREKCFFFLYGSGDNGKSTFIELIADLLGDYWGKTTAETVLSRPGRDQGIPNDVAKLAGLRFVSTAELSQDRQLDEARVKDLTGRDTISARFLRAEWFEFRPVFKLWIYGNHKPQVKGQDDGIWKRVRLIPFAVTIPKGEQDGLLANKLRAELPGILNWAVQGCLGWQKSGLPLPTDVQKATEGYRAEMDTLAGFLDDRCFLNADPTVRCRVGELYNNYSSWCREEGEFPESKRKFGTKMKARGFGQTKATGGAREWLGVGLTNGKVDESHEKNGLSHLDV